jgi:hypothetical protein
MAAVLLIGDAPWTSVLRFYTIALVLAIGLVRLRVRLGRVVPWILLVAVWALAPLWSWVPWPLGGPHEALRFFWGSLFGTPAIWVGGSVWHNLSLVAMGMILGGGLRARTASGQTAFPIGTAGLLAGICLGVLATCTLIQDPVELLRQYAGDRMALRTAHHPAYYVGGGLSALLLLGLVFAIVRGDGGFLAEIGRRSLLMFAGSGVLLNLVPERTQPGLAVGILLVAGHLAVLFALVAIRSRCARKQA